jgi:hypothetical protein
MGFKRWFDFVTTRGYKSKFRVLRRQKRILIESLSGLPDVVNHQEVIQTLVSTGALEPADLHYYLKYIFSSGRVKLLSSLIGGQVIRHEALRLYHSVRLANFRGEAVLSARELRRAYEKMSNDAFLKADFFCLVVEQAVREAEATLLVDFLSQKPDASRQIPTSCFMGVCWVLIHAGRHDECRKLLRRYLASAPSHLRLYFLEPVRALFDQNSEELRDLTAPQDWRSILKKVEQGLKAIDEDNRRTFSRHVARQLYRIPEGTQDYMDIRFDVERRARLLRHIADAIERKQRLSFVRIGDGEGYAYDGPCIPGIRPEQFAADKLAFEQQWWGATLDPEPRAEIGEQVRAAIAGAMVLGIPSIYRIIREIERPKQRLGSTRTQRGLLIVLNALGSSIPIDGKIFTEERANYLLFDQSSLKDLADRARKLVIVACWPPDKLALATTVVTEYVPVSPNMRVPSAAGREEAYTPLHVAYPDVIERIAGLAGPGVLVLVSAGIIGKIFVDHACRFGAVAIDIGAVADYLAGYKTRSVANYGLVTT